MREILKKTFDKIYCINLDHRVDRWESAKQELSKYNILDLSGIDEIHEDILNDLIVQLCTRGESERPAPELERDNVHFKKTTNFHRHILI